MTPPIESAPIEGVTVVQLRKFSDERGWFCELRRESWYRELLGRPAVAADEHLVLAAGRDPRAALARARPGRPLLLPAGTRARGLLDRREDSATHGVAWSIDIDGDNCLAVYIPGQVAHGFEALTDVVLCYHVTEEYDPADPDEQNVRWDDERVRGLWSTTSPILSPRDA